MLNRKPQHSTEMFLRQARLEIEDGSPARRQAVAERWIGRLEAQRAPLEDKRRAIVAEYKVLREAWTGEPIPANTIPHAEQEEAETAHHFRIGGWTATAFELMLTAFVSITTLTFFWLLAGLIGVIIAILLSVLVKSFLSTRWNAGLPRASVRHLRLWVWRSFWVCLVGLGSLLVARTIPFLGPVADVALAILSLALPILAGSFFVLAHIYDRFTRLARDYERVRVQVVDLDQLLRQLRLYVRPTRRS